MKKQNFFGKIISGVFQFRNGEDEKWAEVFSGNLQENDNIKISVERISEENYETLKQMRYYRGVICRIIGWEFGYEEKDQMHQILAKKFLSYTKKGKSGKTQEFVRSTAIGEMTTKEWIVFVDQCWEFGKEWSIRIPTPEEIEKNPKILEELYPEVFRKKERGISIKTMKELLTF